MKCIECPEEYEGNEKSLFLAGGISGCGDWQKEMAALLAKENLLLINPRRKHFSTDNLDIEKQQIKWEFDHLKKATAILFWFPKETLCPITLYELGKCSMTNKKLFIGVDPQYARKRDVEIQTSLIRPEIKIVHSMEDLAKQVKEWNK